MPMCHGVLLLPQSSSALAQSLLRNADDGSICSDEVPLAPAFAEILLKWKGDRAEGLVFSSHVTVHVEVDQVAMSALMLHERVLIVTHDTRRLKPGSRDCIAGIDSSIRRPVLVV